MTGAAERRDIDRGAADIRRYLQGEAGSVGPFRQVFDALPSGVLLIASSMSKRRCWVVVFDALPSGVLLISAHGRIMYYNAAYARLRGIAPDEMIDRPVGDLDHRQPICTLLGTGMLPPDRPVSIERRRNREVLIPLREGEQLLGAAVIVTRAADSMESRRVNALRGGLRPAVTETTWIARYTFADIIGESPALVQARALGQRAAHMGRSVLIVGESGTGKELFAHAIHAASPKRAYPFVPVDCSAIPKELLEAELFGYAPGAFTGAAREGKIGKFELAHGGTLFLDEIGEMPLEMQAKLLRVLQERLLSRVGGVSLIPVAFTVIAATNQDLESLVHQGRFRRDLLYRLDVVRIEVPPLCERPEDIAPLVEHYWRWKSQEMGVTAILAAKARQVLEEYSWPGNVREVVNVVERLLVSVSKPVIGPADLPPEVRQELKGGGRRFPWFDLTSVTREAERRALVRALHHARGNRTDAAQLLGLSRASFYRKLKGFGLDDSKLRDRGKTSTAWQRKVSLLQKTWVR